jgi:hypothetical protein
MKRPHWRSVWSSGTMGSKCTRELDVTNQVIEYETKNFVEQNNWETNTRSAGQQNSPYFMKAEGSLLCEIGGGSIIKERSAKCRVWRSPDEDRGWSDLPLTSGHDRWLVRMRSMMIDSENRKTRRSASEPFVHHKSNMSGLETTGSELWHGQSKIHFYNILIIIYYLLYLSLAWCLSTHLIFNFNHILFLCKSNEDSNQFKFKSRCGRGGSAGGLL